MSSLANAAQEAAEAKGLTVHTYNAPCLMVFSIIGLVLQIPVIYTHSGLFSRPNVPVILISAWYTYLMLSTIIAARYWDGTNTSTWWSGSGWCDIDVRLYMAACLGILSAQCAVNWNIFEMLADRPSLLFGNRAWIRGMIELAGCLLLPVIHLAVYTFETPNRYDIIQGLGCSASTDTSAAIIITYYMWVPILGAAAFAVMMLIAYRFWRRGSERAMATVSFMPYMNTSQFVRIVLFSLVVTCIFVPLIICVAVVNFLNIHDVGVSEIAWAHGKPANWNAVASTTLDEVAIASGHRTRVFLIISLATRYINVAIACILFICYGTGKLALEAYKTAICFVFRVDRRQLEKEAKVYPELEQSPSNSSFSFSTNFNEWNPEIDGSKALKEWESGLKTVELQTTSRSSFFSYTPPTTASSQQKMLKSVVPQYSSPVIPSVSSSSRAPRARGPSRPVTSLISGLSLPWNKNLNNNN